MTSQPKRYKADNESIKRTETKRALCPGWLSLIITMF